MPTTMLSMYIVECILMRNSTRIASYFTQNQFFFNMAFMPIRLCSGAVVGVNRNFECQMRSNFKHFWGYVNILNMFIKFTGNSNVKTKTKVMMILCNIIYLMEYWNICRNHKNIPFREMTSTLIKLSLIGDTAFCFNADGKQKSIRFYLFLI